MFLHLQFTDTTIVYLYALLVALVSRTCVHHL